MGRKAEIQRMQLEKLMGPEAMGLTTEQLHFSDGKVCKNFLCGTCPHDLFSNTKVDLGPCPKSHTSRLKDDYKQALAKGEKHPIFDAEYEDNIRIFMADIDRKIAANKRRIDQTPEETAKFTNLMHDISEIETAMNAAMAEVERLGEQGEVELSLQELQKAEALKQEKADRERDLQILSDSSGASGHQKLRVCDVCGAYLSILDSDRRLADHFGGRMHLGYLRLREIITEFDERRARGEDPRTLIAQGVGARPSASSSAAPTSNGHGYGQAPPPGMGPRSSYVNGGGRPNPYGAPPPSAGPSMNYNSYSSSSNGGGGYSRDGPSGSNGPSSSLHYGDPRDRDRDPAERERRERERRERRGGDRTSPPPSSRIAGDSGGYRSSRSGADGYGDPRRRTRSPDRRY